MVACTVAGGEVEMEVGMMAVVMEEAVVMEVGMMESGGGDDGEWGWERWRSRGG